MFDAATVPHPVNTDNLTSDIGQPQERGAVLVLVATMMLVLLVAAGLAVDISSRQRQGQELQNIADAAALAGATAWNVTGDQGAALAAIDEIATQNGLGDEVTVEASFPNVTEVDVVLVNNDPDVYFGAVVGLNGKIERDASASLITCADNCESTHPIPPPLGTVQVAGTGDGFTPILHNDRIYAVNHNDDTASIQCVDRHTQDRCWPTAKDLTSPLTKTANTFQSYLHDDRLFTVTHLQDTVYLTCFNLDVGVRCGDSVTIPGAGRGQLVGMGTELLVFTETNEVYCYTTSFRQDCDGHSGARPTGLNGQVADSSLYISDHRVIGDRAYMSLSANSIEMWLHCWDQQTDTPCADFGIQELHATSKSIDDRESEGRLFVYRTASGDPTAICSTGANGVECFDPQDGSRQPAKEATVQPAFDELPSRQVWSFVGRHSYHSKANRLYLSGTSESSWTSCFDFTTGSRCGDVRIWTSLGRPWTYGVVEDGDDCLVGVGHKSIFFSRSIDLYERCPNSAASFLLERCGCSGTLAWPLLQPINTENIARFEIRITDGNGVQILPATEGDWAEINDVVELELLGITTQTITVEARAVANNGQNPWNDGLAPAVQVVSPDSGLRLIE